MSSYYVFRINYNECFQMIRKELLNNHILRQGWGKYDMQLDKGYESFKNGWQTHWEKDLPDESMKARYNNLCIMKEIAPGDYIIIPKISTQYEYVCKSFVIARCKAGYRFSVLKEAEDFGHIIEVDDVFSCSYDTNLSSQIVKSKFIAYQSPLNRVKNDPFINAVNELVRLHNEQPSDFEKENMDLISMISSATVDSREQYLIQIRQGLRGLDNHKFEDIICELFEKNGYSKTANNWFDRNGGDVDIVFECFGKDSLMSNIFDTCSIEMPHIYVQAKKKTGNDSNDVIGVEQLIKMKELIPEKNPILMVINLTECFSDEAKTKAYDNGIILIDGITFASLLVRHGIF